MRCLKKLKCSQGQLSNNMKKKKTRDTASSVMQDSNQMLEHVQVCCIGKSQDIFKKCPMGSIKFYSMLSYLTFSILFII